MLVQVELEFGKSYLPMDAIIGAESLSAKALEAIGVSNTSSGEKVIINVPKSPADEKRVEEPSFLFFGTQVKTLTVQ